MNHSDNSHGNELADLEYLIDELEALKYLIEVVPVYERPGNELSICEHIRLIHFIQDQIMSTFDTNKTVKVHSLEQFTSDYKSQRSDLENERKKGVTHYINKLIQARTGLIKKVNMNQAQHDYVNQLSKIVYFDRLVFKEIAEKVLSINNNS
jgi:hypothetical protein